MPRARAAGAGRHGVDRKVRARRRTSSRRPASSTTCSTPRTMSAKPRSSRRPAASARSRFRPTWPAAAPISCSAAIPSSWRRPRPARATPTIANFQRGAREVSRAMRGASASRCSRPAACTSSAPSATSRGASTTSCAAVRDARAIPARRGSYLSLEDDLLRIFGADRLKGLMGRIGMEDGVPIEHRWISQGDRKRAEEGRGAQLRHPQASARIRRRDEPQREVVYHRRTRAALGRAAQGRHRSTCATR